MKEGFMLELTILILTVQWFLSLFGQSAFPSMPHTGGFIYTLSVLIIGLILMKFIFRL
ncbi:MAG: hypothetical protein KAY64_00095 [Anaerolineales bacterium]|nr:hypothetical protein [Anaerolineales bacterium]